MCNERLIAALGLLVVVLVGVVELLLFSLESDTEPAPPGALSATSVTM